MSLLPTRRAVLAGTLAPAFAAGTARAISPWPSRTIRLVVLFATGGSTDVLARFLAEKLQERLGQQVIVENRGGAGGTLGSDGVAKSPPDGYTLLVGVTGTHGTAPAIYPRLPYDPVRDFAAISRLVMSPLVILVRPDAVLATIADYVAAARTHPDGLSYGTSGTGTSMHLSAVQFALATGAPLRHVPYRGSAPAFTDLIDVRIDTLFGDILLALPQIQTGTLKALAVTSPARAPLLPDVPTIAETLVPGFGAVSWRGLFAPARTPKAIVERLNREVKAVLLAPDVARFFREKGFEVSPTTPEEFRRFVEAEIERWREIARAGGVKAE